MNKATSSGSLIFYVNFDAVFGAKFYIKEPIIFILLLSTTHESFLQE
jgi:hypothetical protein